MLQRQLQGLASTSGGNIGPVDHGAGLIRTSKPTTSPFTPMLIAQNDLWSPMLQFGGHQYHLQCHGTNLAAG